MQAMPVEITLGLYAMIRWLFGQKVRNLCEFFSVNMLKYQQMRLQSFIKPFRLLLLLVVIRNIFFQ